MNDTEPPRSVDADGVRRYWVFVICLVVGLTTFGVLFSGIFQMRSSRGGPAYTTVMSSTLKQLATSVHCFHDQHKQLPPAIGLHTGRHGTVHFHILPFLEQEDVYRSSRVDAEVHPFLTSYDTSWRSGRPYEGKYGFTSFPANWLAFTTGPQKDGKAVYPDSFPDGMSETIMFGMRYQMCNGTPTLWGYDKPDTKAPFIGMFNKDVFQIKPSQAECDPTRANTWSTAIHVVMFDSSVHRVEKTVSPRIWALLLDPADGEKVPANWWDQ